MKKIIYLIATIITFNSYAQMDDQNIQNIEKRIDSLKAQIDDLKKDETSLYYLKKDIIDSKLNYQIIDEKIDAAYKNWFTKYFDVGILIGSFFGIIGFWIFQKNTIKAKIAEQIAKLTQVEILSITNNLEEYIKHTNYKKNAKIIILNEEGTSFHEGFKRVMNLYGVNTNTDKIDIKGLDDALKEENLNSMKNADLVIIENQVEIQNGSEKHWKLAIPFSIKGLEEIKSKATEGTQYDRQPYQNNLNLIKLANSICKKTAIVYYGQQGKGNFPSDFVDPTLQHMITFANAPAQLYGNMLNMLKFQNELKHA